MAAMRTLAIPPGEYVLPHAGTTAAMNDPAYREKVQAGPVAFLTVLPNELPRMGKSLLLWFVYCLVVGTFAGDVTSRALGPGADYDGGLPLYRNRGVRRLYRRQLAELNLVRTQMEHDGQEHRRWIGLRAADGWIVQLALAVVGTARVTSTLTLGSGVSLDGTDAVGRRRMAKSGRQHAPRDRRRPYRFPKPPCQPAPPRRPERPRPPDSGCGTGPDPQELLDRLRRKSQ